MPFNGSGVYSPPFLFVQDAANGIKILASRQDTQWADVAGALNICLTRDSQGKPTQDWDANTHKIINLANGSSPQDAVAFNQLVMLTAPSAAESHSTVPASILTGTNVQLGNVGTPAETFDNLGEMVNGLFTATRAGFYYVAASALFLPNAITWTSQPQLFFSGTGTGFFNNATIQSDYPNGSAQRYFNINGVVKMNVGQNIAAFAGAAFSGGSLTFTYSVSVGQIV